MPTGYTAELLIAMFGVGSLGLMGLLGAPSGGSAIPSNAYVAEDGITPYVAEDGTTFYIKES